MDSRVLGVLLWVEIHHKALRGRNGGAVHQTEPAPFQCGEVDSLQSPSGRAPLREVAQAASPPNHQLIEFKACGPATPSSPVPNFHRPRWARKFGRAAPPLKSGMGCPATSPARLGSRSTAVGYGDSCRPWETSAEVSWAPLVRGKARRAESGILAPRRAPEKSAWRALKRGF